MGNRPLRVRLVTAALVAACVSSLAAGTSTAVERPSTLSWKVTQTGQETRYRGISAVSAKVAWAGGYDGAILRTTDGGLTWDNVSPADAVTAALQFRDVEAWSARDAVAMSAGPGEESRIYRTSDGGATWAEVYRNTAPAGFYDCMAFTDRRHGVVVSDPVDGQLTFARTSDGGRTWTPYQVASPAPLAGEYYFAASGTCLADGVGQRLYLGSGGSDTARVLSSRDGGRSWTAVATPLAAGEAAGIFSVAFRSAKRGIIVGGDYLLPDAAADNAAYTTDGGLTWHEPTSNPAGYRSAVGYAGPSRAVAVAIGPSGSDYSTDGGRSWHAFSAEALDSLDCTASGVCWAGGWGVIARLTGGMRD